MAQTRFLVLSGSQERQIFSARPLSDGSCTLIFKTKEGGLLGEVFKNITNNHITIHSSKEHKDLSNERPIFYGRKIKHTFIFDNGNVADNSIIVKYNKRRPFIWPVISTMSSALFGKSFEFSNKNNDTLINLIGYLGAGQTICYTLYVSDEFVKMPQIQGFSKYEETFEEIKITLYITFFNMFSWSYSIGSFFKYGPLRVNNNIIKDISNSIYEPVSIDGIEYFLQKTHSSLRENYLNLRRSGAMNDVPKELLGDQEEPKFTRWPSYTDEVHEAYGILSRLDNPIYEAPNFVEGIPKPKGYQTPLSGITIVANTPEELERHGIASRFNKPQ